MNTKKITAFIVGAMLIATVLVMAVSAAGMDRSKYADMPRMVYEFDADNNTGIYINDVDVFTAPPSPGTETVPTLRIYGEKDAIYPTHSYYGTDDFVYPDPVDPFDPGILAKDSVTFDPAYVEDGSIVDDVWGDEKVFYRVFYEPGYAHGIDTLMKNTLPPDGQLEQVIMTDGALVTETTYMMVTNSSGCSSGSPCTGAAGVTQFELPTLSDAHPNDLNPGMDHDDNEGNDLVDLLFADNGSALTDGTIEVGITVHLDEGESVRFMDHEATLDEVCWGGDTATFTIGYLGNRYYATDGIERDYRSKSEIIVDTYLNAPPVYVDRYHITPGYPTDEEHRWFIRVADVENCDGCNVTIGRRLVAGETFYVDGVRYDMPAIYVTGDDEFKYITLQSPLPKCPSVECDCGEWSQEDFSHVSCQWLAMLCMSDPTHLNATGAPDPIINNVWVLPPFNVPHVKIDDINLTKTGTGCPGDDITVNPAGEIFGGEDDELKFYYIEESIEARFNSSLAERHHRKDGVEMWNWWNVYTKPYNYTTLVLPDDETDTEHYCNGSQVDGFEYIVTTSYIAPNSEDDNRHADCKDPETHDIIDRAATIALVGDDSRDAYEGMPRTVFEYDAVNTDDLFVNDDGNDHPTVRIYGEEGATYPTHSMTGALDFIYPDAVDPFDPGIIPKDSVTFNPAYLENAYGDDDESIKVDGGDSDEKVFFRAFYEPGYAHAVDDAMYGDCFNDLDPVEMLDGAFVTETTYMLLHDNDYSGHSGDPKLGGVGANRLTKFMLPIRAESLDDINDGDHGMDVGGIVELTYAEKGDIVTNGTIEVERSYDVRDQGPAAGRNVEFMDHHVRVDGIDDNYAGIEHVTFDISYVGNIQGKYADLAQITMEEGEKLYFNRNNIDNRTAGTSGSDQCYRWYLEVVAITYEEMSISNHVEISLGRRLVAGETFYVDGVRYDMPAIYVEYDPVDQMDKFKYITFQSPMPKCDGEIWYESDGAQVNSSNQQDESHVTSQWLANLIVDETVPVLPPFNENHLMIDDIDLRKGTCGGVDVILCTAAGNILDNCQSQDGLMPELDFCYINELTEPRFESSLAERHNITGGIEEWDWWNIFTKPYHYTELVLPDDEDSMDTYMYGAAGCGPVDGNEYLITTSFIAPNCEGHNRTADCKPYDTHDIIDRVSTLLGGTGSPTTCPWDLNGDDKIDVQDIVIVANHWGEDWPEGEFSGDTTIDVQDIVIIANHWGNCPT